MFCIKCGAQLQEGFAFCAKCGAERRIFETPAAQQPEMPAAQPYSLYNPYEQPNQNSQHGQYEQHGQFGKGVAYAAPKKGLRWFIIAPVAAVVAAAIGVGIFFLARGGGNSLTAAIAGAGVEMAQRLENSPLGAFPMLFDAAQNGTITVGFYYEDRWGDSARGNFALTTNTGGAGSFEQALIGDVTFDGETIDFEMFLSDKRLAVRSQFIDSSYYGITYSTFRSDIQSFGSLIGLDRQDMDEIANIVEQMDGAMDSQAALIDVYGVYADIFGSVLGRCEQKTENVRITPSSGEAYNARRTDIFITKEVILGILNDLYDALADDENLRNAFDLSSESNPFSMSYNEFLSELRGIIRDFEGNYSDTSIITVSLYIGSRNRLMQAEVAVDVTYDGDRERFDARLDFGTSATDKWTLEIDGKDFLSWEYKEQASTIDNIIYLSADYGSLELSSVWNPGTGAFTLGYREGRYSSREFSGVYNVTPDGFTMRFDNLTDSYYTGAGSLSLEISASSGGDIPEIDYINLDKWDEGLLLRITDAFGGLFGYGGYFDPPWPGAYDPTPPGQDAPVSPSELVGAWEFYDGTGTYFFWASSYVEFYSDGTVSNFDDEDFGTWSLDGVFLTITDSYGYTYVFTVSVSVDGNALIVTDHDNDTGYFARIQ